MDSTQKIPRLSWYWTKVCDSRSRTQQYTWSQRWAASGNWPTWLALCRDAGGMRFIGCSLEIATDGSDVVAPFATHRKVAMFVAQWHDARRERP